MTDCVWMDWKDSVIMDKICYIAKHYGLAHQLDKTVEECIELVDAINHKNPEGIKEELADVQVMIWQIQELYGYTDINDVINAKLNRQLARMEAEDGLEK